MGRGFMLLALLLGLLKFGAQHSFRASGLGAVCATPLRALSSRRTAETRMFHLVRFPNDNELIDAIQEFRKC